MSNQKENFESDNLDTAKNKKEWKRPELHKLNDLEVEGGPSGNPDGGFIAS